MTKTTTPNPERRNQLLHRIKTNPVYIGKKLGFTKLTSLHNEWIQDMMRRGDDETLQSHRGSYKTTCVSIALALICVIFPNDKTLFMRKTNTDVLEVIAQVKKMLQSDLFRQISLEIWGVEVEIVVDRADCIVTNLAGSDPRGTMQLQGIGTQASLTGKHFDRIFTDDIVNLLDRMSKAERDRTKAVYQELQNIKNRGGRIFNTGTPWHKDDCFTLMPAPKVCDCYNTGLISQEELKAIRESMTASLFAANYELRHIAAEDVIFTDPQTGADISLAEQGICHIDAAYGGEDFTAFTIMAEKHGKYYIYGRAWQKHVDDCLEDILQARRSLNAGKIYCEDNGDKGYLAKELKRLGERVVTYHENMNKFIKITSYLKAIWKDVIFVSGTDEAYINMICDYNEEAEHDDPPDSAASLARVITKGTSMSVLR